MTTEGTRSKVPTKRKFRGVVHIDRELCKGCGFCVEFCPKQALALSSEFNSKGYHPPVIVNGEACTGGGLCSAICPDFAIHAQCVRNEDDEERS